MASFVTANQFDKKYKVANFGGDCNACPIFALFSAKRFMENPSVSKEQHDKNLEAAIMNYVLNENSKELPKYMSFTELLHFTGGEFNDGQIGGLNPEIINEYGYQICFKPVESTQNYAIIFLKNSNFIVVLVKHNPDGSKLYCLRDCHETDQYDFDSFDALSVHLSEKYQFNNLTIVDGVLIEEYGNIEYLLIDKPFEIILLDQSLYDDEGKVETDDFKMTLDIKDLTSEELMEIGLNPDGSEYKKNEQYSSQSSINSMTNSSNDLSLDELMALQLQYGDDAY